MIRNYGKGKEAVVQLKVRRRVQETFSINRLKQGQWPTDGVKESGETLRRMLTPADQMEHSPTPHPKPI